jgi:phage protein D
MSVNLHARNRSAVKFTVEFPTLPSVSNTPTMVTLHQKPFTHDVLVLTYPTTIASVFDNLVTGIPVKVKWNMMSEEREWVGYVTHVTKTVALQQEKQMEVICIGASYVLKERATRVFVQSTIPDAVAEICKEFGLAAVVDAHDIVFPQLSMAGHTYWQWIVEQAKKIGYTVYLSKTTLYFRKLNNMIDQSMSSVPSLFFSAPDYVDEPRLFERTLNYFKVVKGSHVEQSNNPKAKKITGGVDPHLGTSVQGSAAPELATGTLRENIGESLFTDYRTDRVVNSAAMGSSLAGGSAELARLSLPAKVKGQGDPRMRPFQSIYIQGTGQDTDGYWVIDEVKHTIISGDYTIDMTVLVDGLGPLNESPTRKTDAVSDKLVDITERIKNGTIQEDYRETQLKTYKAAILPSDNGFISSPSRWVSSIPGKG